MTTRPRSPRIFYRSPFGRELQRICVADLNILLQDETIRYIRQAPDESIVIFTSSGLALKFLNYRRIELLDYELPLELMPLRLLVDAPKLEADNIPIPNAIEIQHCIYSIRQVYALVLLLQTDRVGRIADFLESDLERE